MSSQKSVVRKNTGMRILRVLLWGLLIFFFIRGVIVSLRPDPTKEVNDTIENFQAELVSFQETDNEILAFAENFAVNYMTYEQENEADYVSRVSQYASKHVVSAVSDMRFSGRNSTVLYSKAYRKEEYSKNQYNVWVLLTVQYDYTERNTTTEEATEGEGSSLFIERTVTESTILKIPVYANKQNYIIEDVPLFVNDDIKDGSLEFVSFSGKEAGRTIAAEIETSLNNFYKAYYEYTQNVINYYLTPTADPSQFIGLNGRVSFQSIGSLSVYYTDPEKQDDNYTVIVTVVVTDKNGMELKQNFNLQMQYKDGQYHIGRMDTRTTSLK